MGTVPKIESSNLSIADLLRDFYSVPDFQREYVWSQSNVEKLLEDIYYSLYENDRHLEEAEYFLGSIVVFRDKDGTFQLIDGQQRVTTTYLIFCVIRNCILELGQESKFLDNLIAGVTPDLKTGEDINKYRLSLHYDSADAAFLKDFVDKPNLDLSKIRSTSSSCDNLKKAIKKIKQFLTNILVQEPRYLKQFSSVFANQVKLIRIETPNLKNALKVFETVNERGIGLTPIDLLKNYLFLHTSKRSNNPLDWEKLKSRWEDLMKILYRHKEDPMRFLRYYIVSHYDVDLSNNFPEENIYDWFLNEENEHNISDSPLNFVDELITASEHYCNFTQGKNIDGSNNKYLENIRRIQGRYRQHFILLLAGRHLNNDLFERLCLNVENLLFVHAITRSDRRKDINLIRTFSQWSEYLRHINNNEQLTFFINKYFYKNFLDDLNTDFESALLTLTDSNIAKYRLRYILAKISQFIEQKAYSNCKPLSWYLDKSIHVEHILPRSTNIELINNFDKSEEYNSYLKKLGNLTLLEETINTSIVDKSYEIKKDGYRQSQLLITRSLAEKINIGNNTQLNRAVCEFELNSFDSWSSESIEIRHKNLVNLAKIVWGLHKCF